MLVRVAPLLALVLAALPYGLAFGPAAPPVWPLVCSLICLHAQQRALQLLQHSFQRYWQGWRTQASQLSPVPWQYRQTPLARMNAKRDLIDRRRLLLSFAAAALSAGPAAGAEDLTGDVSERQAKTSVDPLAQPSSETFEMPETAFLRSRLDDVTVQQRGKGIARCKALTAVLFYLAALFSGRLFWTYLFHLFW